MKKFYHIDRMRKLNEGDILELNEFKRIGKISINGVYYTDEFNSIISDFFGDKVSSYCLNYINSFLRSDELGKLEFDFELIRRLKFQECPSRYQSFFAVAKDDIKRLMDCLAVLKDECDVYEVESNKYFKADMNLLKGSGGAVTWIFANMYWKQQKSKNALYEYLLEFPIKIVRKLDKKEY